MTDDYTRGVLDARREFAQALADVTEIEIDALDFTADRLRAELQSRWLERRHLADGTVPAVGQRVVTIREVEERWGLAHGHDDHVHEITSLLGGDTHLVECGPEQIGVGMLRLAPEGSEVTCPSCRGWSVQTQKMRVDAIVYRETQFKVAKLEQRAADAKRERDELAEVVGQALVIPTLGDGEALSDPKSHALIDAMLTMRARESAARADRSRVVGVQVRDPESVLYIDPVD